MTEPRYDSGVCSLRDFFSAQNARELQLASTELAACFQLPLSPPADWVDVEYDFNRLFVGPLAVPAPLYASAYQDEALLMGTPAIEVRSAYQNLGFSVPDMGSTPDDHLAYELDAVALCDFLIARNNPQAPEYRNISPDTVLTIRRWLVTEHMQSWVPAFVEAVNRQHNVSQPVELAVNALSSWLTQAADSGRN